MDNVSSEANTYILYRIDTNYTYSTPIQTGYLGTYSATITIPQGQEGTYWFAAYAEVGNVYNFSQLKYAEYQTTPSCPSLYFWNGSDFERRGFILAGAMPRKMSIGIIFH
jgi:hypothetical protein